MNQERRRVVITGIGVVAPNGHGKEEYSKALRDGTSGLRFIPKMAELKFACHVGVVGIHALGPVQSNPLDVTFALHDNVSH